MELTMYQIDAFADKPFAGNPAAVVPLQDWLPDSIMQSIALENNLSETAFFVANGDYFHLRWFTPANEVRICGHATLASAYVLFNELGYKNNKINFQTLSGVLSVRREQDLLAMSLPRLDPTPCEAPTAIIKAFPVKPIECLQSEDYIVVFRKQDNIQAMTVDFEKLKLLDLRGVAITSESDDVDFVTRFFAPKHGIPEDPVTGSAFCQLAPYWSGKLKKNRFRAKQVSPRGGLVDCELEDNVVQLTGKAAKFLTAAINIDI